MAVEAPPIVPLAIDTNVSTDHGAQPSSTTGGLGRFRGGAPEFIAIRSNTPRWSERTPAVASRRTRSAPRPSGGGAPSSRAAKKATTCGCAPRRPKAWGAGPTIATRRWPRACARPIGVCRSACGRSDGTSLGSQARVDEGGPPPSTPPAAVGVLPLIGGDVGASAAIGGADDAGGGVATSTVRMHTHAFG